MYQTKKQFFLTLSVSLFLLVAGCDTGVKSNENNQDTAGQTPQSAYFQASEKHLVADYPTFTPSGNINVVVEIPTGTNAKWEVDKSSGDLQWTFKNGKPRVVAYLSYPGNYGMIPGTSLPKGLGGDGDPLDVLIIGNSLPRGTIIEARPIGVLKLLDNGEQDDKIIAVLPDSIMGGISSMEDLDREFNGISDIIEIWFSNYKGPGEAETNGFGSAEEARKIIGYASDAYNNGLLTRQ
jgi:inorganic pyrophosphatase